MRWNLFWALSISLRFTNLIQGGGFWNLLHADLCSTELEAFLKVLPGSCRSLCLPTSRSLSLLLPSNPFQHGLGLCASEHSSTVGSVKFQILNDSTQAGDKTRPTAPSCKVRRIHGPCDLDRGCAACISSGQESTPSILS